MPELQYRTEDDRVAGAGEAAISGDPFHPQTEAQRVAEAARGQPELRGDYPRWVEPHKSRIVADLVSGALHVPGFPYHVRRGDNQVTVLVQNEEEEKHAVSETEADKLAREAAEAEEAAKLKEANPT